jgi:hypothetical protein
MRFQIHIHSPFFTYYITTLQIIAIPLGTYMYDTHTLYRFWQAKVSRVRNIWLGPEANQRLGSWLGDFPRLHSTVKVLEQEDKTQ